MFAVTNSEQKGWLKQSQVHYSLLLIANKDFDFFFYQVFIVNSKQRNPGQTRSNQGLTMSDQVKPLFVVSNSEQAKPQL